MNLADKYQIRVFVGMATKFAYFEAVDKSDPDLRLRF